MYHYRMELSLEKFCRLQFLMGFLLSCMDLSTGSGASSPYNKG